MKYSFPKIDAYSALLGGGVVLTLWYLLADHPKPSYADPPASGGTGPYPTSPLPPSLQNLPPPPPVPLQAGPAGQV